MNLMLKQIVILLVLCTLFTQRVEGQNNLEAIFHNNFKLNPPNLEKTTVTSSNDHGSPTPTPPSVPATPLTPPIYSNSTGSNNSDGNFKEDGLDKTTKPVANPTTTPTETPANEEEETRNAAEAFDKDPANKVPVDNNKPNGIKTTIRNHTTIRIEYAPKLTITAQPTTGSEGNANGNSSSSSSSNLSNPDNDNGSVDSLGNDPDNASTMDGGSVDENGNPRNDKSLNFSFLLIAGIASIGLVAVSSYKVLKRKSNAAKLKDSPYYLSSTVTTTTTMTSSSMPSLSRPPPTQDGFISPYDTMDKYGAPSVLATILDQSYYQAHPSDSKAMKNTNSYRGNLAKDLIPLPILKENCTDDDSHNANANANANVNTTSQMTTPSYPGLLYSESAGQMNEDKRPKSYQSVTSESSSTRLSIRVVDEANLEKRRSYCSISSCSSSSGGGDGISKPRRSLRNTSIIRHSFLNPNLKIVRMNSRTQLLYEATENQPAIMETFPSLEREFVPAVPVPLEESDENTLHPYQIYQTMNPEIGGGGDGSCDFENYYAYTIEDKEYIIDPSTNRVLEIHDLTTDEYMVVEEELYLDFSGGSDDEEEEEEEEKTTNQASS